MLAHRKTLLGCALGTFGMVVLVLLALPRTGEPRRVQWFAFNRDAIGIMNSAGFVVIGVASMTPEEIPIPWRARLRELLPFRDRIRLPANELEPTTLRIVAQRPGGGQVRCLARYHEGFIAVILLRYSPGHRDEADELRRALRAAYPRERIELQEDPPA